MGRSIRIFVLSAAFFVVTGSLIILALLPAFVTSTLINEHIEFETVYDPKDYELEAQKVSLVTKDDNTLAAWEVAVDNPHAVLIFLGGLNDPPVSAFWGHARLLAEHGYASLLIELRAHGESSGEQISLGYAEHFDVLAGLQYLQGRYLDIPIVAYGADLGGVAAINAAGLYPELAGVVSIGAFSSWPDLFRDNLYFSGSPLFLAMIEKPFVKLHSLIKFGFKNRDIYPQRQIMNLGTRPALLMHSLADDFVSSINLERIMQKAPKQVETWYREGPEHLVCTDFLHPENDLEYANRVLDFLNRNFAQLKD